MNDAMSRYEQCMSSVAGVLLTARQLRRELAIGDPDAAGIVKLLSVSRSQMYSKVAPVRDVLTTARTRGRPPLLRTSRESLSAQERQVYDAVRDWFVDHPSAVYRVEQRMHYSDGFRAFVIALVSPGGAAHNLTQEQTALVLGMSKHTLAHWLSPALPTSAPEESYDEQAIAENGTRSAVEPAIAADDELPGQTEPAATGSADDELPADKDGDDNKFPSSQWAAMPAQVLYLWGRWKGGFAAFCRSLPEHGIDYSYDMVKKILALGDQRPLKRRRDRHPDAEAIRGELTRLFPNAQWNADGKNVLVQVGDATYRFTWELVVDNATTGHLGFSIRDHEDSTGVLEAMEHAETTAGEPPVAFLRDPRKSNTAAVIEEELDQKEVLSMFSPVGRPQSNSPAENAFSLFQQKMPPIYIPEGLGEKQLAQLVLWYVLFAYSAGRNQTPRRRLKNRTPAQSFEDAAITDEQKAQAREQLRELRRRVEEQEAANRRRCAPALKQLLTSFFADNGLDDPRDRYIHQIGAYGPEAALEAMAVFLAKKEAGTLSAKNHERYLLGIARNVAYRREDQRTYSHLLDLRAKAGDLVLESLIEHNEELRRNLTPVAHRKELLDLALDSTAKIDRVFWGRRFLELFEALSPTQKKEQGRWCARRIAGRSKLPHRERDQFIALLAEAAMPMAV
jgi:hypothetical protein